MLLLDGFGAIYRPQFIEQIAALGCHQSTVGQCFDHQVNVPEVTGVGGGTVAIVLAEVEASAADIHVPLESSVAASSSLRRWAGLEPRHGADAPLCARGAIPVLVVQKFALECCIEVPQLVPSLLIGVALLEGADAEVGVVHTDALLVK